MDAFEAAGENIVDRVKSGLDAFATIVMDSSKDECPVETGTLKGSARIFPARETAGDTVEAIIGYGFGDEVNPVEHRTADEYAVYVHELVEKKHKPPTKAKFLEDPVLEHAPMMGLILKAFVVMTDTEGFVFRQGVMVEGGTGFEYVDFPGGSGYAGSGGIPEWPVTGSGGGDHEPK